MEKITGVGGAFFKARDPSGLAAWYSRHLGVPLDAGQTYGAVVAGAGDRQPIHEATNYGHHPWCG